MIASLILWVAVFLFSFRPEPIVGQDTFPTETACEEHAAAAVDALAPYITWHDCQPIRVPKEEP